MELSAATIEQFEKAYDARRLGNWELPKWHPPKPKQRKGSTQIIANEQGHLFDCSKKLNQNPWGALPTSYALPETLTRRFGQDYNTFLNTSSNVRKNSADFGVSGTSLKCPTKFEGSDKLVSFDKDIGSRLSSSEKRKPLDLEYTPGDFTSFKEQHPTRDSLLENKFNRDYNIETDLKLDNNLLGDHICPPGNCEPPPIKLTPILPPTTGLANSSLSPRIRNLDLLDNNSKFINYSASDDCVDPLKMMPGSQTITGKPHERCPSPVVPAFANFELAKRMHQTNLDHQPLPDCVADLAFRKLQITGDSPGLALDLDPIASGVGVKTHNAGPTHCTKMKVYRPKTGGVVPRSYSMDNFRASSASFSDKKMGAMDLAIGWDYKPSQEPRRPRHIDGSNDSAGPAVFNYVKSPRDDPMPTTGRSAGVFTNTLGETGFFDKDILRRKTDFGGHKIQTHDFNGDLDLCPMPRANSVTREEAGCRRIPMNRFTQHYQSSPDMVTDQDYKALRDKYLGPGCDFQGPMDTTCKRNGFFKRARARLCKIAPEPDCFPRNCPERRMPCKGAFRAGVPRYDAGGHFISADSGCSMGSQRVLVVPRPRNPYSKKNYDIDTLVPPFKSYAGGAGEGGYPEHWRLASVYQHAYKPMHSRRKPLIQTVYK